MKLSLTQGTSTIIITFLGSGVFIVPAISATYSGWFSLIIWFFVALMILPVAFVFGKLGQLYPSAGGSATFVKEAFGKKLGKITTYLYLSIIPIGPPVVIITAASYLASVFGDKYIIDFIILASAIILILNLFSLHISSNINIIITITIITIISMFLFISFFQNHIISYSEINFIKTIGIIFWCFVGIEALSHISHEFNNEKDFYKAVILGIFIVTFLYMSVTFALLTFNAFGNEQKNLHSLVIVASNIFPYANKIIAIIAFSICIMALNLYVASLSRLATTINIPFKKALFGIILIILIISILKITFNFPIHFLITYANGVFVTIYFLVALSAYKLLTNKKIAILAIISMSFIIYTIGFDMIYTILIYTLLYILSQ